MSDNEKFDGFKRELIDENERKYGKEVRGKYGDDAVDRSNAKLIGINKAQYEQMQQMAADILAKLSAAVQSGGSPSGEEGREIALLHKQWLAYTWPEYSADAHLGLTDMYVDDARFTAYYDSETPGCARFLRDAVHAWKEALR